MAAPILGPSLEIATRNLHRPITACHFAAGVTRIGWTQAQFDLGVRIHDMLEAMAETLFKGPDLMEPIATWSKCTPAPSCARNAFLRGSQCVCVCVCVCFMFVQMSCYMCAFFFCMNVKKKVPIYARIFLCQCAYFYLYARDKNTLPFF
jgi:hypothetical protein